MPLKTSADRPAEPKPFVTISRQGGAGGRAIAQRLVARLNALDPGEEPWAVWDKQLVEKIAEDHKIARELVESLGESSRTWLEEFLAALSIDSDETEARIYQMVASTIRALAHKGRVVIVGRGGVYITRSMPGGVHLRLVAPVEYRARHMADQLKVSYDEALSHVRKLDKQRAAFYRKYWPSKALTVEAFTLTINTAMVSEEQAVESALPLILPRIRFTIEQVPEPELAV